MSLTETAKAVAAEERTDETRSFVRTVNAVFATSQDGTDSEPRDHGGFRGEDQSE